MKDETHFGAQHATVGEFASATDDYLRHANWLTELDGPRVTGARALARNLDEGFSVAAWDRYQEAMGELANLRVERMSMSERVARIAETLH